MNGLAARAHPFTVVTMTLSAAIIAFLLPGPFLPLYFYLGISLLVLVSGVPRALRQAAVVVLPLWAFLFIIHGLLGPAPKTILLGGFSVSNAGLLEAMTQGCRLGAVVTLSLALLASFRPARLLDAVVQRGWSFHAAYLLVATLDAAPRFARKAAAIVAAQRARGLRVRGSLTRRIAAITPLTMPLILGALAEADERATALDVRGADLTIHRTPLDPPRDTAADRLVRWLSLAAVAGVLFFRFFR